MKKPEKIGQQTLIDLDGLSRTPQAARKIDALVWRISETHDGERLLNYLKNITMNHPLPPTVSADALRDMEGRRNLVGMLLARRERHIKTIETEARRGARPGEIVEPDMPEE